MRPHFWLTVSLALLSLWIFLPITATQAEGNTWETTTTETIVRDICRKKLQSNGGVIGCTVGCGNGDICDFSCGGPEGKDCRVVVFPARLQSPETKSVLGGQVVVQGLSTEGLVSKVCGQIKDRNRNANGVFLTASGGGGYGCFNPNTEVIVICDATETCKADGPKSFPVVTLRGILLGLSKNPFEDGSSTKSKSGGGPPSP